jgi:hypothetical protein
MRLLGAAICMALFLPGIVVATLLLSVARTAGRSIALSSKALHR